MMRALLALAALATAAYGAETIAIVCPAHGPFRVLEAVVGVRDTEHLSTCHYDTTGTIGDFGVQCECAADHTLAGCGAQMLLQGDGTAIGVCLVQDWAGNRRVTWKGRVK